MIYQVSSTLQALVKVRKSSLQNVPHKLPDLLHTLEIYTSQLKVTLVFWDLPTQGRIKVNTDEASRGKPSRSSIWFVLRDKEGDVRFALGKEIQEVTNMEVVTILEALRYCVQLGTYIFWCKLIPCY